MRVSDILNVDDDREFRNICDDSRNISPGDIFVAYRGKELNGADYIEDALSLGALCVITDDKDYEDNTRGIYFVPNIRHALPGMLMKVYNIDLSKIRFYGIVGTSGKTTTSYILKHMLSKFGRSVGLIGTTGAYIGDRCIYYGLTTPKVIDLYRIISEMQEQGICDIVMEISVQAIEYEKIFGLKFSYIIFTNISPEHMDSYSYDEYVKLKLSVFDKNICDQAIVNVDDEYGRIIEGYDIPHLTYGLDNPADAFAVNIEDRDRLSFTANICDDIYFIDTSLFGSYNVYNILSCMCIGYDLGYSTDMIESAINSVGNIVGRGEVIKYGDRYIVIDFAHTVDSIDRLLEYAHRKYAGDITVIIGCTGYSDKEKRKNIGAVLDKYANFIILTSDNPLHESVDSICADIALGIKNTKYIVIDDRSNAINYGIMHNDGVLLLLGKGGERYQKIGDSLIDYSDREEVENVLGRGK